MEWIKNNLLASAFIVIFLISILIIVISSIVNFVKFKRLENKSAPFSSRTVGMEIDLKNARVIYFEKRLAAKKRTISMETFFQNFHKKDVLRVKLWLEDIKRNFDFSEKYLETEIMNGNPRGYFMLFKTTHYDEKSQIVYLEGHELSKMNPSQGRKRTANPDYALIKKSQIESIFESQKKKTGYVFSIRFFYRNNDVINDTTIERSILYRLKNEVYLIADEDKNNCFILDEYDDQISLFNFKILDDDEAQKFGTILFNRLQKYLNIKSFGHTHGVCIGAISMMTPNTSFSTFFQKSKQASEAAKDNELPFLIMNDQTESLQTFDDFLVEKVFDNDSLRLLYRPIINVNTEETIGYFSNVRVVDTHFDNYFDIARYINKVDRNEELLSKVLQQFVSKFYFERPDAKARLFVQISLVDLDHLGTVLTNISHSKDTNLVLLFEESEVNANAFSLDLLTAQLNEIISLGYEIALLLKDEDTLLVNEFYGIFNYFVIGSSMVSKIRDSSRVRLSNKFLIESLLQYKRPIVINDLVGWSSIDLFIKSGCTLLSGDDISPSNEMLLPIEKSKIARLRKINN